MSALLSSIARRINSSSSYAASRLFIVDRRLACAAALSLALSLLQDFGPLDRREVSLEISLEEAREDGAGDGATAGAVGACACVCAGSVVVVVGGGGGGGGGAAAGATGRYVDDRVLESC